MKEVAVLHHIPAVYQEVSSFYMKTARFFHYDCNLHCVHNINPMNKRQSEIKNIRNGNCSGQKRHQH